MPKNLDIAYLRTFALIAQGRTFAEVGDHIGRSQSAVSLQMRALERDIGHSLFIRHGAKANLTRVGEQLLTHALKILDLNDIAIGMTGSERSGKAIRLGIASELGAYLGAPLAQHFSREYPSIEQTIRVGITNDLLKALRNHELDLVLGADQEDSLWRESLFDAPLIWIGSRDFERPLTGSLPLALSDGLVEIRRAAIHSLRGLYSYRISASSSDSHALLSIVAAGLAVSPGNALGLSSPLEDVGDKLALPKLPSITYSLYGHSFVQSDLQAELRESLARKLREMCKAQCYH